jgi:hypothetical protein
MPIDIRTEPLLSLTQAAKLPIFASRRSGRPINVSTLWRWSTTGIRGIRLETIKAGGTRATTLAAIERFFRTLTDRRDDQSLPTPTCQTRERRQRIEAAERRLAAAGV